MEQSKVDKLAEMYFYVTQVNFAPFLFGCRWSLEARHPYACFIQATIYLTLAYMRRFSLGNETRTERVHERVLGNLSVDQRRNRM